MKTYIVCKSNSFSLPGKAVGDEVVVNEADESAAEDLVKGGYLKVKPTVEVASDPEMNEAVVRIIDSRLGAALKSLDADAKSKGLGFSLPSREPAEPKEAETLGEWFQCMAFAASPTGFGPDKAQWGRDRLVNKYHSRQNSSFAKEYNEAAKGMGQLAKAAGTIAKAADMIETQGSLGGFALPDQFYPELFKLAGEKSLLLSRVKKFPMESLEMSVPTLDYTGGGSGASPYNAGMIAGWGSEGTNFNQTNAVLDEVEFKAGLLCGFTRVSRTLLADNKVGLQFVLTDLIGTTIGFYSDLAIFSGNGVNQPKGLTKSGAAKAVTRTGSPGDGDLLNDLAKVDSALLPEAEGRAFWMIAPSSKAALYQLNDKSGRVVYLPTFPSMDGGPATRPLPLVLFGKPVYVSQLPASSGTATDFTLVDPELYWWANRQDIEIGVSEHESWLSNKLTWRFLFRGDGKCPLKSTVTLANGDVVSPFPYLS